MMIYHYLLMLILQVVLMLVSSGCGTSASQVLHDPRSFFQNQELFFLLNRHFALRRPIAMWPTSQLNAHEALLHLNII